jgi:hypothetical protein
VSGGKAPQRRRTWKPLIGRLWGPGWRELRSLPGEWAWRRRKPKDDPKPGKGE